MKLHRKLFWLLILLLPVQLGRHFWPDFTFILGLKIDYLAPTLYLSDILIVGILGLWGWEIRRIRYLIGKTLKRYWWVIAIFIYLLVNALLAQNQGAALYKFIRIIEFSLLGLYVAKNRYSLLTIRYPLFWAVVYSSLIATVQFFKQSSLGGLFYWLGERTFDLTTPGIAKAVIDGRLLLRPYSIFSHPNSLAGFLLIALILTTPFLKRNKFWYLVYVFLAGSAIVFSFSRSVWLIGLLILFIFGAKKIKEMKIYSLKIRSLILSLGFLFFIFYFWLFNTSFHFSTDEAFFQRTQLIKSSILMIKEYALTGVGLNNFIVYLPNYWAQIGFTYWLQPVHNIFLLIMTEIGLIGLLIFLWFLFLTFKRIFKKSSITRPIFLTGLTAILLLGLTDHYWLTLQQNQLLLTILLGLAWSSQT